MARQFPSRDITPILSAAELWLRTCLIEDKSVFLQDARWTPQICDELFHAFVEHPDYSDADFITKLKGQIRSISSKAQQLSAEMLWALLLFPSNIRARTKRQQVRDIWAQSGQDLPENHPLLTDHVLVGVGSAGPGFNTYRPDELAFLIALTRDLKQRNTLTRQHILGDYDAFIDWINSVPQQGHRQLRHLLRFFAFPDRVERISANGDRISILDAFSVASSRETRNWSDHQLDDALLTLRRKLEADHPSSVLDFYEPPLRERWSRDRKIKTLSGEITVTVPEDDEDQEENDSEERGTTLPDVRQSLQMQAALAEIGVLMGFKIWIPRADRARIRDLVSEAARLAFLDDLLLNYETTTLATIEQIDVLWLKGRFIARAFEVEHTTAIYSGLLRMADLLALQPNINIRLHIVAPDERREKVRREMLRPVFSLLERGPLAEACTFISYESVETIRNLGHLAHTNDSIIEEYEEKAEP